MTRPSHASDQASKIVACALPSPTLIIQKGWLDGWCSKECQLFFPFNSQLLHRKRPQDEKGHSFTSLHKSPPDLIHNPTCLCEVEVYCVVLATNLEPMQIQ